MPQDLRASLARLRSIPVAEVYAEAEVLANGHSLHALATLASGTDSRAALAQTALDLWEVTRAAAEPLLDNRPPLWQVDLLVRLAAALADTDGQG